MQKVYEGAAGSRQAAGLTRSKRRQLMEPSLSRYWACREKIACGIVNSDQGRQCGTLAATEQYGLGTAVDQPLTYCA